MREWLIDWLTDKSAISLLDEGLAQMIDYLVLSYITIRLAVPAFNDIL